MRSNQDGKKIACALAVAFCLTSASCGKRGPKAKVDELPANPNLVLQSGAMQEKNLAELMAHYSKAAVTPQPWVGYWWPYLETGIASSVADNEGMSPADKYDAAYLAYLRKSGADVSKFESLAAWERGRHGPHVPKIDSWFGHCNGWSASAVMVAEPTEPKTIEGIVFQVKDLKALLAESWMEFSGDFVGTRVDDPGDFSSPAFWDVVPAQFHLVLANIVGRQNRGIIVDRHTGHEIWNQPLVGYAIEPVKPSDYLGAHPSYPDIYRVNMTAWIWWANDNVSPDEVTPKFDVEKFASMNEGEDYDKKYLDHFFPGRMLRYELWLDGPVEFDSFGHMIRSGDILVTQENGQYAGGVWKNGSDPASLINSHPDYMWMPFGVQPSTGNKNPRIDDTWVRANIGSSR